MTKESAMPDGPERLQQRLRAVKEWPHQVSDGFAALNSDAEYGLRMRTRALLAEYEAAVNTTDPGPPAEADAGLRARLCVEAQRAYWELYSGAGAVAAQVAATLTLPAPHRFPGLPVNSPEQLVAALPAARPPRAGTPLPARILKVFRPGWSGIMMTLIAVRLLGVQLPGAAVAAIAVAGALVLGWAAFTGERKRQLDRRRADATVALRGTVEDFRLTLTKELRDASRWLQSDLRRASATAGADRVARLTAELKAARTSDV
jgi:hypothetical protein